MRKIISIVISLFIVFSSISGSFVVLASAEENLWKDISVSDFNTKDQSLNGDFDFEQYTDGTYGAAFHIKCAWYTSFYIAMPTLEPDTEYQISFRYNNFKTEIPGTTIEEVHVLNENELAAVDENGKVADNNATCIASCAAFAFKSENSVAGSVGASLTVSVGTCATAFFPSGAWK